MKKLSISLFAALAIVLAVSSAFTTAEKNYSLKFHYTLAQPSGLYVGDIDPATTPQSLFDDEEFDAASLCNTNDVEQVCAVEFIWSGTPTDPLDEEGSIGSIRFNDFDN